MARGGTDRARDPVANRKLVRSFHSLILPHVHRPDARIIARASDYVLLQACIKLF
jgi:hypothetical protein